MIKLDFNKIKYQHVEKLGTDEVEGIEDTLCYVFPKIDGTNGVLWWEDNEIHCGSRKRELSLESDNAGFYNKFNKDDRFILLFKHSPQWVVYGEYLVKHTVKYKSEAMGKFYVFDVFDSETHKYVSYDEYQPILDNLGIDYIPLMAQKKNVTSEDVDTWLQNCTYLTEDNKPGEGIVLHSYDYINKYGRYTWAKVVRNEYKANKYRGKKKTEPGINEIESQFIEEYCTEDFIRKEYEKLKEELGCWNSKQIPRLLNTIYHELVVECTWSFIKKHKLPSINFRVAQFLCQEKVKAVLSNVF